MAQLSHSTESGTHRLTIKNGIATFTATLTGLLTINLAPFVLGALGDLDPSVPPDFSAPPPVDGAPPPTVPGVAGFELPDTAGLVLSISLLATALAGVIAARFTAGHYRRIIAQSGLAVAACGFLVAALNISQPLVMIGVIIGGIGIGAGGAAGGAALAVLQNTERVVALNGFTNRLVVALLLALIPVIGLTMLPIFGVISLVCLFGIFAAQWLPTPDASTLQAQKLQTQKAGKKTSTSVVASKSTAIGVMLSIAFAIWGLGEDSLWTFINQMAGIHAGLGPGSYALITSLSTASGILAAITIATIGDRISPTIPIVVLVILGSGLKFWLSTITDGGLYIVVAILWNTVYSAIFMYVMAIAANLDVSGRWSGQITAVYLFGSAAAPFFGGLLLGKEYDFTRFGVVISLISLAMIVPFVIAAQAGRKNRAALVESAA